jgi:hypothetical protein
MFFHPYKYIRTIVMTFKTVQMNVSLGSSFVRSLLFRKIDATTRCARWKMIFVVRPNDGQTNKQTNKQKNTATSASRTTNGNVLAVQLRDSGDAGELEIFKTITGFGITGMLWQIDVQNRHGLLLLFVLFVLEQ